MPSLSDLLEDESRTVDLEPRSFERLIRRRERRRRHRRVVSGAVALAIALTVLGGLGWSLLRSTGRTPSEPAPSPDTTRTAQDLVWSKGRFPGGSSKLHGELLDDDEHFYILNWRSVFVSTDGLAWAVRPLQAPIGPRDPHPFSASDAYSGKILRLVVDGVGEARTVLVDTSDGSLVAAPLPIDASSPLASSEDLRGTVAFGNRGAVVYLWDNARWSPTSGDFPTAIFSSDDGLSWRQIPDPPAEGLALADVVAIDDGFIAIVNSDVLLPPAAHNAVGWFSRDGIRWGEIPGTGDLRHYSGMVRSPEAEPNVLVSWGDSAFVYLESAFGPPSLSINAPWRLTSTQGVELKVDLPPLGGSVASYGPLADAGGMGVAAVFDLLGNETGFVEYSPDGVHWSREPLPFRPQLLAIYPRPFVVGSDRMLAVSLDLDSLWVGQWSE